MTARRALVTGATGYIGSRLVPALLREGWTVRVLTRDGSKIEPRDWADQVEVSEGNADDAADLAAAMTDVDVAYYFIHSMDGKPGFVERDRNLAQHFARIAEQQHVGRIIYLSGLYPPDEELSTHLGSRKEVEDIFLDCPVPAVVLRAAVILGAGSASFEMLRHLTERLPVMIAPRWLDTRIQPIAIADVVRYLVKVADLPPEVNRGFDIGAEEVLTYRQMIARYAAQSHLVKRRVRTVPVMTPGLASHWVGLVTPVPSGIAKPLVGSLVHEVVCKEHDIADHVPDPEGGFVGFDDAVTEAQEGPQARPLRPEVDIDHPGRISAADPEWAGATVFHDRHRAEVDAPPEVVWSHVEQIGGEHGWHVPDILWQARGLVDRAVGGRGHAKHRDPGPLQVGMQVDSWVVAYVRRDEHGGEVALRSLMRLPGEALLIIGVEPGSRPGASVLTQTARFTPSGLAGLAYWGGMWPAHTAAFLAMHRGLAHAAEAEEPAGV